MKRSKSTRPKDCPFVSRGGLKLQFALDSFNISVAGSIAIDLGCSTGGFTDCLLSRGAKKVYAVDKGYGVLEYKLRIDDRVVVHERTNALQWSPPEKADITVVDLGWTRLQYSLSAAARMISKDGLLLVLLKPQYEAGKDLLNKGVLPEKYFDFVVNNACKTIIKPLNLVEKLICPIKGSGGNTEVWLKIRLDAPS